MSRNHTLRVGSYVFFLLALPRMAISEEVVAEGARIEAVGRVAFTEGPLWHPSGNVYFSDIENNRIMRMDRGGKVHLFRHPSGRANGLTHDLQGRLVACEGGGEGGNRRITRTEIDGTITVLADRFEGKRFNSPNDIVCDASGNLFFTDPRYGDRGDVEMVDEAGKTVEGVYRISPTGNVTRILGSEIQRPNGIAVSPDGRFLFVAVNTNDDQGDSRTLWRFGLSENREIVAGSQKKLFDWGRDRGPDGMAIDREGRLYVTAGFNHPEPPLQLAETYRAGVYVISSSDGQWLDFIPVPIDMVTNCAFGGEDGKTLYVTAGHKLWSVPVRHAGYTSWPTR